jgi:predicted DNA-binding protein YlxM (UPF0122 family)
MEKHSNKLDWPEISNSQKLSESFIRKNINKINGTLLMYNDKISTKLKEKIKKEVSLLREII